MKRPAPKNSGRGGRRPGAGRKRKVDPEQLRAIYLAELQRAEEAQRVEQLSEHFRSEKYRAAQRRLDIARSSPAERSFLAKLNALFASSDEELTWLGDADREEVLTEQEDRADRWMGFVGTAGIHEDEVADIVEAWRLLRLKAPAGLVFELDAARAHREAVRTTVRHLERTGIFVSIEHVSRRAKQLARGLTRAEAEGKLNLYF